MAGDNTVIFKDASFNDQTTGKTALVDFWATWCGPCRQQGPIIDALATDLADQDFVIGKMDIDSNPDIAQKFQVMSIPTLLVLKDGEVVQKFVGVQTADVLKQALEEA